MIYEFTYLNPIIRNIRIIYMKIDIFSQDI
jgi:hypothetical protein